MAHGALLLVPTSGFTLSLRPRTAYSLISTGAVCVARCMRGVLAELLWRGSYELAVIMLLGIETAES